MINCSSDWKLALSYLRSVLPPALRLPAADAANAPAALPAAVHCAATKCIFGSEASVHASLSALYSTAGLQAEARHVLDELPDPLSWNSAVSSFFHDGYCAMAVFIWRFAPLRNAVTWSALVAGLAQNGRLKDALRAFRDMRRALPFGETASSAMTSALAASARTRDARAGQQVHAFVVRHGATNEADRFVGAALVDMYGRCACLPQAFRAFHAMQMKSISAWCSLAAACVTNGDGWSALEVFRTMSRFAVRPNEVTQTTLITACGATDNLLLGKEAHAAALRRWPSTMDAHLLTAMVDMYSKCGRKDYAHRIVDGSHSFLGSSTPASMWNALIADHVGRNRFREALSVIRSMKAPPNGITVSTVLPVCGRAVSICSGKELHCYAVKNGLDGETTVANGLLDMYCRCGATRTARHVFDGMRNRSVVSWTAMINGYGMDGDGARAIKSFEEMVRSGDCEPDHVTFVALISACSHSGLVEDGLRYFEEMMSRYGIRPVSENMGALVDLLSRAGYVDEAWDVMRAMPMETTANTWAALLSSCRIPDRRQLQPEKRVQQLLANIYSQIGKLVQQGRCAL